MGATGLEAMVLACSQHEKVGGGCHWSFSVTDIPCRCSKVVLSLTSASYADKAGTQLGEPWGSLYCQTVREGKQRGLVLCNVPGELHRNMQSKRRVWTADQSTIHQNPTW